MDGFNSILDTGKEEGLKMIKDKSKDGKELEIDFKLFELKSSKMLIVNLMIILFHLRLDRFYYIGGYELVESDAI